MQTLLFGASSKAVADGRVVTLQTVGSSSALKVGADFIKRWFPGSDVWVSDPTWDNHRAMFEGAGLKVSTYPYYDAATGGVKFPEMIEAIGKLAPKSIVLLHACCHNPTGVDLSPAQWEQVIATIKQHALVPFVEASKPPPTPAVEPSPLDPIP